MRTANCLECARKGKHILAINYSGYVIFFDEELDVRNTVYAGWCKLHDNLKTVNWPHKKSIGGKKLWCFGLWKPEYGLIYDAMDKAK